MHYLTIAYDNRGRLVRKTLPDSYAARRFYARMFKAGRKLTVVYREQAHHQAG